MHLRGRGRLEIMAVSTPMTNPASREIRKSAQALLENRASASRISKASKYKKQIDQFVYKLYTLTAEEIEIVEGRNENKQ